MTAPAGTQPSVGRNRRRSDFLGKKVPNLVLVRDSGQGAQFRIQCEIDLDETDANAVEQALWGEQRTMSSLESLKKLVVGRIAEGATPTFVQIVSRAFEDQDEYKTGPSAK